MRALLVVDRRFIMNDGICYTEGPRGPETGERYLAWFDKVVVAGRQRSIADGELRRLNRVEAPGLTVTPLPNIGGLANRFHNLSSARQQLRDLISLSDAVIARLPTELGVEASNLAMEAHKPLALEIGGCVLDGLRAHGTLSSRLYAPLAFGRMKSIVRRAKWVSFVTQAYLQSRYPTLEDATVLACSNVDIPPLDDSVLKRRFDRIEKEDRLVFGTIGSLYGNFKGIQFALRSLASAASQLPPFIYRILGGGDPTSWRTLAADLGLLDRVHFDGAVPAGNPVLEWLDGIDIYLQPSLREGLPRALIEAMSRGCPALASNVAGIPELLPPRILTCSS